MNLGPTSACNIPCAGDPTSLALPIAILVLVLVCIVAVLIIRHKNK